MTPAQRLQWEIAVIHGTRGQHGLAVRAGSEAWEKVVEEASA